MSWADLHEIPSGGSTGQALVKKSGTNYDTQWANVNGIPSGGSAGQVLAKSSNLDFAAGWTTIHELPSGGTAGQALVKKTNTNHDVQWAEIVPGKIQNQYNAGANYVIEFRTTSVYGTPVFQIRMGSGSWFTIATS